MKKPQDKESLRIHFGVRLPYFLHKDLLVYALRNRITLSEATRRLLASALKYSRGK